VLLSGLRTAAPDEWRFSLFFHRSVPDLEVLQHPAFATVLPASPPPRSAVLYEQLGLPSLVRATGVDVLFSPGYSLPPRTGAPAVVTLHDLSFERLGGELGFRERWRRRHLARRAARKACRVLVDTAAMREEVRERYRLPTERLGVVPLAVESRFHPRPAAGELDLLARRGVVPPYLLFVGSLLDRRCPELMVAALADLGAEEPGLRLVLAGPDRLRDRERFARLCGERGVADRVVRLGWVVDDALPPLYRHAAAVLYLSRYEGFGLPPLEALACGAPAVVGAGLALDELWPDYPFRVSALEPAAVLDACRAALRCDREELVASSRRRLGASSWERSAALWMTELERALP
jgi:glycosyltransferase involved in cell wall biosynthesis